VAQLRRMMRDFTDRADNKRPRLVGDATAAVEAARAVFQGAARVLRGMALEDGHDLEWDLDPELDVMLSLTQSADEPEREVERLRRLVESRDRTITQLTRQKEESDALCRAQTRMLRLERLRRGGGAAHGPATGPVPETNGEGVEEGVEIVLDEGGQTEYGGPGASQVTRAVSPCAVGVFAASARTFSAELRSVVWSDDGVEVGTQEPQDSPRRGEESLAARTDPGVVAGLDACISDEGAEAAVNRTPRDTAAVPQRPPRARSPRDLSPEPVSVHSGSRHRSRSPPSHCPPQTRPLPWGVGSRSSPRQQTGNGNADE